MIPQVEQEDPNSITEPQMRADQALEPPLRRGKHVCDDPLPRARPRDNVAVEDGVEDELADVALSLLRDPLERMQVRTQPGRHTRARPERRVRGVLPARGRGRRVALYVSGTRPAHDEARHLHVSVAYPELFALQHRIRREARRADWRARDVEPSRVGGGSCGRVASMCRAPPRRLHLLVELHQAIRYRVR